MRSDLSFLTTKFSFIVSTHARQERVSTSVVVNALTKSSYAEIEAGAGGLMTGEVSTLEGAEPCECETPKLGVPYHRGGDGRLSIHVMMHTRTAVSQHPDVDADDDGYAAHVQVDQVDTLHSTIVISIRTM